MLGVKMKVPLFTCVIPVKGERPYFNAALASLRGQGMGDDLEIIVQDADAEPDEGQSDALNKGFAKAHGEWLFWLNSDDLLLPGALRKVSALITNHQSQTGDNTPLDWITGDTIRIDSVGKRVGCSVGNAWHDWLYRHAIPHVHDPSSLFRRELLKKIGGFNATLHYCMDFDLWIRFMQSGARFVHVGAFLWGLRQWSGSKTQCAMNEDERTDYWKEFDRVLTKNKFDITRGGIMLYKGWRVLRGCYLKEWLFKLKR